MHVQPDEQRGTFAGRGSRGFEPGRADGFLPLDRFRRAQYVCLHGVCFPFNCCFGRESHNRWLGTVHAVQPTFNSESRHRFHFHRQPYCLGSIERMAHLPAYICSHVFRNERPILLVVHNRNGDWKFLCGESHDNGEPPEVVGVEHLLDRDSSLEKLHDLPLGWSAKRQDTQSEWRLSCDEDDA